jgi:hypothetical protein
VAGAWPTIGRAPRARRVGPYDWDGDAREMLDRSLCKPGRLAPVLRAGQVKGARQIVTQARRRATVP